MRLVMAEVARNVWVSLEAETPEEMASLEASAARGEWTNGRGKAAIVTLGALAARLGYPVGPPEHREPSRLIVVRRGLRPLYERLAALARGDGRVIWDRRERDRRVTVHPAAADRRRQPRRRPPPPTWATLGFLVAQPGTASG